MHRLVVLSVWGMLAALPASATAIFVDTLPNGDSGQASTYVDSGAPIAALGNGPARSNVPDTAGPYNYSGMGSFAGTSGGTGIAPQAYIPGANGIWGGGAGGSTGSSGGSSGSSGGATSGSGGAAGSAGGSTGGAGGSTPGGSPTPTSYSAPAGGEPTSTGGTGNTPPGGGTAGGPEAIAPTPLFASPTTTTTSSSTETGPAPLRIAEPASLMALGGALVGLGMMRRRKSR